jgi:hypothetical protein
MATRTFPCGPIMLEFDYDPHPVRVDLTRTAAQLRQIMNDPQGLAYIPIRLHPQQPVRLNGQPGGIGWRVRIRVDLPVIYVAREFQPESSPAAVNVLYHERGHIKPWLDMLAGPQCPFCPPISAAYARASSAPHPTDTHVRNAINSAITQALPGVQADLEEAARRFDRADYPHLHAALRAIRAPIP